MYMPMILGNTYTIISDDLKVERFIYNVFDKYLALGNPPSTNIYQLRTD